MARVCVHLASGPNKPEALIVTSSPPWRKNDVSSGPVWWNFGGRLPHRPLAIL
jgi:hypothetical protein